MAVVPLWSSSSTIRETQKWGNSCNIPSVLGNERGNESTKRASPMELELTHTHRCSQHNRCLYSQRASRLIPKSVTTLTVCLFVLGKWNGLHQISIFKFTSLFICLW